MYRDHTKVIKIGNRVIGGGNPILIQSMTNTKTEDVEATVAQILSLEKAGCDYPLRSSYYGSCEGFIPDQKTDPYSAGCGHPF